MISFYATYRRDINLEPAKDDDIAQRVALPDN